MSVWCYFIINKIHVQTNTESVQCFPIKYQWNLCSNRSHVGRSILAVLPATILEISRVSNNPTRSARQSLFIIFAARRHCCLVTVSKGERGRNGTESTRAALSVSIAASWLSLRWGANWIQTTGCMAAALLWALAIAHLMCCLITYEIRTCRRFSRD